MVFGLAVQKFLNIEWFLHWESWRNWNVPLVLWERSWWTGFNGIYLVRFGFRMWEILIFKWFLPTENSNKFPKTSFTNHFKHDFLSYLAVQNINTYIAKQCSHVEFPYFVMCSHYQKMMMMIKCSVL
jgi:hypothetical protein